MAPQQTMTEKDMYAATMEREYQITRRMLEHYPADKLDLQPTPKLKPARDIIWVLTQGHFAISHVIEAPGLTPGGIPQTPPATLPEILAAYETVHRDTMAKLGTMTDAQMNETIKLPVGPGRIADVRRGDAMWMFLYDGIHHRGQLNVYQRIAGGKVPSIYGPSGDEPWM